MKQCAIPPYNDPTLPRIPSGVPAKTLGESRTSRLAILNEYSNAIGERDRCLEIMIAPFQSKEKVTAKNTATILTTNSRAVHETFPKAKRPSKNTFDASRGKYVVRMTVYYPEPITLGFDSPCETAEKPRRVNDGIAHSGFYLERRSVVNVVKITELEFLQFLHIGLYRYDETKHEFHPVSERDTLSGTPSSSKKRAVCVTIYYAPMGGVFAKGEEGPTKDQYVTWFRQGLVPLCGTYLKINPSTYVPTEAICTYKKNAYAMTERDLALDIQDTVSDVFETQKRFALDVKGKPRGHKLYRVTKDFLSALSPSSVKSKLLGDASQGGTGASFQKVVDACAENLKKEVFGVFKKYVPSKRDSSAPDILATRIANSVFEYKFGEKKPRLLTYASQRQSTVATNTQVYEHEIETIYYVTLIWVGMIIDLVRPIYYLSGEEYEMSVALSPREYTVDVSLIPVKMERRRLPTRFWEAVRYIHRESRGFQAPPPPPPPPPPPRPPSKTSGGLKFLIKRDTLTGDYIYIPR